MRRRLAVFAVLLVLGAQSGHAQDDAETPPDKTKMPSGPEAFVASVYERYADSRNGGSGEDGSASIYSARLQGLLDKDVAETPEGEVGRLDFDPIVDGQDWDVTGLKITEIYRSGDAARVRAVFANLGEPRNILFDLVREDGQWRVDDIAETLPPRWVLSEILTGSPGAFPDAEPAPPDE